MAWSGLDASVIVDVSTLAVAGLVLAVAAFVLLLDFSSRVHRAFALLLVIKGVNFGLFVWSQTDTDWAFPIRPYYYIALPFAALHFALVYRRRHGKGASRLPAWLAPAILGGVALALELLYWSDHGYGAGGGRIGPLGAFAFFDATVLAGIGLLFAIEARRATKRAGQSAFLASALGLSLQPLFYGTFRMVDLAFDVARENQELDLYRSLEILGFVAAVAGVVGIIALSLQVRHALRMRASLSIILWTFSAATGLVMALLFSNGVTDFDYALLPVLNGLWVLGLPILVTYALVRYRLFDAHIRIRFALKGTTLAAFFLGIFFVVAKLTESGAQELFGGNWVVGAIAAGLLLFAISPLQKLAEHLAHRAVPPGKPMTHLPHEDRIRIYREQLEVAWADGTLTQKERILFSSLQQRLALTAEEAVALENDVVTSLPKKSITARGRRTAA